MDGMMNRVIIGMVTGSCRMGRRRCPRTGADLVRNGKMVAEEAVASGKSNEGKGCRRAITSVWDNSQCALLVIRL